MRKMLARYGIDWFGLLIAVVFFGSMLLARLL